MKDALPGLGSGVVMVSLGIDTSENAAMLKRYAEQNGFDWRFALPPRDMVRQLGDAFGTQFLTPPAKPMFIIDRSGRPHGLPFGTKSAEALRGYVQQYR